MCDWTYDEDYDYYETECGETFCLIDGDLNTNKFKFCPYCGQKINLDIIFENVKSNKELPFEQIDKDARKLWSLKNKQYIPVDLIGDVACHCLALLQQLGKGGNIEMKEEKKNGSE